MTAWNDLYSGLASIAAPIMQQYCAKNGYTLLCGAYHDRAETQNDRVTRGDLCKAGMYRQHCNDYDLLCWLDIDSVVMNHSVRVEDILGDRDWLWTHSTDGPLSGFWIARTTPLIRKWVERFSFACAYEYGGGDQYAMEIISQRQPYRFIGDATHCVPAKTAGHCFEGVPDDLAIYGQYQPGDFVITFPALDIATRLEKMLHYATMVKL
jgi:hypothetical protein